MVFNMCSFVESRKVVIGENYILSLPFFPDYPRTLKLACRHAHGIIGFSRLSKKIDEIYTSFQDDVKGKKIHFCDFFEDALVKISDSVKRPSDFFIIFADVLVHLTRIYLVYCNEMEKKSPFGAVCQEKVYKIKDECIRESLVNFKGKRFKKYLSLHRRLLDDFSDCLLSGYFCCERVDYVYFNIFFRRYVPYVMFCMAYIAEKIIVLGVDRYVDLLGYYVSCIEYYMSEIFAKRI